MSAGHGTSKTILWFTDTLTDLNGVSITLTKISWLAHERKQNIRIVTSLSRNQVRSGISPNVLNLPSLFSFPLPFYRRQIIRIPAVFRAMRLIRAAEPDEIYISTPGPVGLLGLVAAKRLNVRSVAIYHTDYMLEAAEIIRGDTLIVTIENYIRWFYTGVDELRSPTKEYMRILSERGYEGVPMRLFRRGIDTDLFKPSADGNNVFEKEWRLGRGFILLFTGRISNDKNIDFLLRVFDRASAKIPDLKLVLAGDGPHIRDVRNHTRGRQGIVLTGMVPNDKLPAFYSAADLFVFPSTTDTFGMSVLEALACGLPCLVSDYGGPQEIVRNGVTGFVMKITDPETWAGRILELYRLKTEHPDLFSRMKDAARADIAANYSWNDVFDTLTSSGDVSATGGDDPLFQADFPDNVPTPGP